VRTELRAKEHLWMYQLLGREGIEYLKSGYPIKDVELTAATKRIEALNGFLDTKRWSIQSPSCIQIFISLNNAYSEVSY
jgi:hypothetical protein